MKFIIGMWHPAHVHFFKNTVLNLEERGHKIVLVTRPKEITLDLLDKYGFNYQIVGSHHRKSLSKAIGMLRIECAIYGIAKAFKPDIFIGINDMYCNHVAKLMRKPSITFTDTEDAKLGNWLALPFAETICTPSCFLKDLGKKHVRYDGYHELAYLHPNYFQPDSSVLDDLNLTKDEKLIILRFISWSASHDFGLKGIKNASDMIRSLESYGRILITSEMKLNSELEKYRITCSPEKIHSLLYYSQLYIGEGGTMATEAAILGTPSIHIESTSKGIATGEFTGNFLELRDKYGLLYFYPDQDRALEKAISILEDKNSKNEWRKRRERLLKDKIDVTAWMVDFIERYPESFYEYKRQEKK
mgnify:CR=1 FL=1